MKILNRIVVFLLGLAVFPVIFFRPIVHAIVSISESSPLHAILSKFLETAANSALLLDFSLKDAIQNIGGGKFTVAGMDFSISDIPTELLVNKGWVIAAGVLLVIALLIALVIMGCALFTQAHKTVIALSAGGMVSVFAALKCFSVFTAPYISGEIDIGAILSKSLVGDDAGLVAQIGTSFLNGAIEVNAFSLGSGVVTCAIIFLGIAMWSFAYYITLPQKPERKSRNKNT